MTEIEQEVSEAMAADPNYPLGETDAMKWAVAWRQVRDRNGIDANASQAVGDIDGWMVGWFANCMASADPKMRVQRDVPIVDKFLPGVQAEMDHQVRRWGVAHDRGKEPEDWFWLIGYLAGKALAAAKAGNQEKALHHTISAAAALGNWHAAMSGSDTGMMPGAELPSDIQRYVEEKFGAEA